jgi:hypothetical protein
MESIDDSKQSGKALVLKPGIDNSTLKDLAFNEYRWGEKTREYMVLVKKLTEEAFNKICDRAKRLSRSTRKAERAVSPSAEVAQKPVQGRRALLV